MLQAYQIIDESPLKWHFPAQLLKPVSLKSVPQGMTSMMGMT
jgi:hypothetical protein